MLSISSAINLVSWPPRGETTPVPRFFCGTYVLEARVLTEWEMGAVINDEESAMGRVLESWRLDTIRIVNSLC